jgi:hypothetical protein
MKEMKRFYLLCFFFTCSLNAAGQLNLEDTEQSSIDSNSKHGLSVTAFLETYLALATNGTINNNLPGFIYSYNRVNEVNINLALFKLSYTDKASRFNLGLMSGTYANANLSSEPGVLKNIYEANAGVRVSKRKEIWIDAGILPSHIGFETAVSKDCPTLTRSMMADNSPYYEAGVRLSYSGDDWYMAFLILNGWQRIQRPEGNSGIAAGAQVMYKKGNKLTLNYSNYAGTEKQDSIKKNRFFNNLFATYKLTKKSELTGCADIGFEQSGLNNNEINTWWTFAIFFRHTFSEKWALASRIEYYEDKSGIIINRLNQQPFQTWAFSLNADLKIGKLMLWRTEAKALKSSNDQFADKDGNSFNSIGLFTTSLLFNF